MTQPDPLALFQQLFQEERWDEALPVIKGIVRANPDIATSWFNLGACHHQLGEHRRASDAYLCAYDIKPEDGGALFRGCLALAEGQLSERFIEVMTIVCQRDPSLLHLFEETEEFLPILQSPEGRQAVNALRAGSGSA
jgi:tetratricopeptide (TPR) repeat protein